MGESKLIWHTNGGGMKYRKKPVVIESKLLTEESLPEIIMWVHEGLAPESNSIITRDYGGATIRTLEGYLRASFGDWIIKGVKGEFYPCKPDIFEATYEKVEEAG